MRQLRFLAFAVISFVAALLGALLSPSTWLHKALAVALCGVLSANPALCTNNAIAVHSQEASATNPVKAETTQFSDLLTQRSRDFDDQSTTSPRINQRSNPPTSDPNTNFIRPEFDNPNLGNTPLNPNNSSQTAKSNSTCSLTGKWQYKANSDFGISDGNLIQGPIPYEAPVQITENSGQIEISGFYNASNGSGQGKRSGSTVTARLPLQIPILGAGKADLTGTLSSDDKTIQGQVIISKNSGGNSVSIPFTMTRQTPCTKSNENSDVWLYSIYNSQTDTSPLQRNLIRISQSGTQYKLSLCKNDCGSSPNSKVSPQNLPTGSQTSENVKNVLVSYTVSNDKLVIYGNIIDKKTGDSIFFVMENQVRNASLNEKTIAIENTSLRAFSKLKELVADITIDGRGGQDKLGDDPRRRQRERTDEPTDEPTDPKKVPSPPVRLPCPEGVGKRLDVDAMVAPTLTFAILIGFLYLFQIIQKIPTPPTVLIGTVGSVGAAVILALNPSQASASNNLQCQNEPQQEAKRIRNCRVNMKLPGGTNPGACVIQGSVMTAEGMVDGSSTCGQCNLFIGDLPPHKGSCKTRPITDRPTAFELGTPVPCPSNWDSGW